MGLYQGTNVLASASAAHDAKLKAVTPEIVPLCQDGNTAASHGGNCPEGGTGWIGVVQGGFSTTLSPLCNGLNHTAPSSTPASKLRNERRCQHG